MLLHTVKVFPSKIHLPKKKQLAWKIAEIASDNAQLNKEAVEMVINRIIDNASVAIASLNRRPVVSSREMAISLDETTGLLFKEAIATEALSIILLMTISTASLFNWALSLAISAIFQASCFFLGK